MKYEVSIFSKTHIVELERRADSWQASIEGESGITADVAKVTQNVISD